MDFIGKTGTAQVIRLAADKIYQRCDNMKFKDRHHALFAGFAPANDPKIAVAVIAEHACHGGTSAAPVAKAIIKTYLQKYFPETYSDKAIAARLKAQKGQPNPAPWEVNEKDVTDDEETEDLIDTDSPDVLMPHVPETQPVLPQIHEGDD
jgi:hypothetical protein